MIDYLKTHRVAIILTVTILLAAIAVIVTSVRTSRLVVPTNQVNVRTGPGLSYRTTTELKKGDVIYVVNRKDNWYRVRYSDHHFGWVASWLVNTTSHLKTATNLSEATIVLDPGHGGSDSGALTSDQQHQEKNRDPGPSQKGPTGLAKKRGPRFDDQNGRSDRFTGRPT
nr:SH3 domain-containing protein [Secundilactobacillus kimchicus]